jgi:hypothetical protein
MLPFPGIPYGFAPSWCFPFVEGSVFVLFVLCLAHALKRDRSGIAYLFGGLVFGVLLEYFEVITDSYTYGHFHIMVGRAPHDLPLWVGIAWGIIMYTARLFSDYLGLPLFAAAALDTLLALNIDVSIDVVAYRLHMWHWSWNNIHLALTSQWFGIPYGNFVGWATVVFCYSGFTRMFEKWMSRRMPVGLGKAGLIAAVAVLSSLAVLIGTETVLFPVLLKIGITSGFRLVMIVAALAMLVVIGWPRRQESSFSVPQIALWVPAWFHAFFVSCFFGFGFYRENPWMTTAAVINLLLGMAIHLYPYRIQARGKSPLLASLQQDG